MSFNLNTEEKLNLGIFIGGFVFLLVIRNTAQMNAFEGPVYLAYIGGILGLARWWAANKGKALKNIRNILQALLLESDLTKNNLTTTGAPLVYAVSHGLLIGAGLGLLVDWVHNVMHRSAFLPQQPFILGAFLCLLLLLLARLWLESLFRSR